MKYLLYPSAKGYYEGLYVVKNNMVLKSFYKRDDEWIPSQHIFNIDIIMRNETPREISEEEAFEIML